MDNKQDNCILSDEELLANYGTLEGDNPEIIIGRLKKVATAAANTERNRVHIEINKLLEPLSMNLCWITGGNVPSEDYGFADTETGDDIDIGVIENAMNEYEEKYNPEASQSVEGMEKAPLISGEDVEKWIKANGYDVCPEPNTLTARRAQRDADHEYYTLQISGAFSAGYNKAIDSLHTEIEKARKEGEYQGMNCPGECSTCRFDSNDGGDYGGRWVCEADWEDDNEPVKGGNCPKWESNGAQPGYCKKHKRWFFNDWEKACPECFAEYKVQAQAEDAARAALDNKEAGEPE